MEFLSRTKHPELEEEGIKRAKLSALADDSYVRFLERDYRGAIQGHLQEWRDREEQVEMRLAGNTRA